MLARRRSQLRAARSSRGPPGSQPPNAGLLLAGNGLGEFICAGDKAPITASCAAAAQAEAAACRLLPPARAGGSGGSLCPPSSTPHESCRALSCPTPRGGSPRPHRRLPGAAVPARWQHLLRH